MTITDIFAIFGLIGVICVLILLAGVWVNRA